MRKSHRPNHDSSVHDAVVIAALFVAGLLVYGLTLAYSLGIPAPQATAAEPTPGIAVSVEIAPLPSTCWHPPYKIDQPPQSWCDLRGNLTIDPTD